MTTPNPFLNNSAPAAAPVAEAAPAATEAPATPAATEAPAAGSQNFAGGDGAPVDTASLFGAAPAGGSGARLKDDLGQLVVIRPTEFKPNFSTSNGPADCIAADWIVCDGPSAGQVREGALIFGRAIVPGLKANLDNGVKFTVGVLGHGEAKPGKSAPLILQNFTPEQLQLAQQAVAYVGWI